MAWGFGKTETEYGIRIGSKDTWYSSKSDRDSKLRRMVKTVKKGGTLPKAIQRTKKLSFKGNDKDKCSGGKCKRNGFCRKHAKAEGAKYDSLYDKDGRNKNTIRWDGKSF